MTTPAARLLPVARLAALVGGAAIALAFAADAAAAAPGKPPGLRIVGTSATSITMSWQRPAGAVRYRIIRNGKLVRTTTARRTTVGGILCGRRYKVAVRAVNSRGEVGPAALRSVRKGTGCKPRSRIVLTNRKFVCYQRSLAQIARRHGINGKRGRLPLLVEIRFTRHVNLAPAVVELRRGCRGDGISATIDLILKVQGNGRTRGGTSDAIKVRENARDIQITGYANCGPRGRGAHQDGAQIQGGTKVEFIDFQWGDWGRKRATCHGAAGTFVPGSVNDWPVRNMACIRCKSVSCNHGMLISGSTGTYVEDSRWRTGRPADKTVRLSTGVRGLCDHDSPPCIVDTSRASSYRIVGNYCDRWPYGSAD